MDRTFLKWKGMCPEDFKYSVKVNRRITHIKRLVDFPKIWPEYFKGYKLLANKLGVILFQFPPSFRNTSNKGVDGLTHFQRLKVLTDTIKGVRVALEFRNTSWCTDEVLNLLRKKNICLVIDVLNNSRHWAGDLPTGVFPRISTANFVYIRLHGSKGFVRGSYNRNEMNDLMKLVKKFKRRTNFIYFNNTFFVDRSKFCLIDDKKIKSAALCDAYTFMNIKK